MMFTTVLASILLGCQSFTMNTATVIILRFIPYMQHASICFVHDRAAPAPEACMPQQKVQCQQVGSLIHLRKCSQPWKRKPKTCVKFSQPNFHSLSFSLFYTRNRLNDPWVRQRVRPRRNRKSEAMRSLVRENIVTPK